jgi:hypothetical protein
VHAEKAGNGESACTALWYGDTPEIDERRRACKRLLASETDRGARVGSRHRGVGKEYVSPFICAESFAQHRGRESGLWD